jgi:prepilin-type N-terminal cleavage/methylation domain-containing protein
MSIIKRNKQKGFTLIELMVGIAIVGLLSSVILVATKGSTNKANIAKTMQWSRSIESLLGPYAVGIWNFDEGSGTTVSDLSGYRNDGTLINNPTWRCAEDDSSYTPSGQGCALEFDGVDDYVEVNHDNNLHFGENDFSISLWLYRTAYGYQGGSYFSKGDSGDGITTYDRRFIASTETGELARVDFNPHCDIWEHHVLTITQGSIPYIKHYINSAFDNTGYSESGNLGEITSDSYNLRIGLSHQGPTYTRYMNGKIDDVRIYKTALTSVQVGSLYYTGLDNLYNKGLIDKQEYQERLLAKQGF